MTNTSRNLTQYHAQSHVSEREPLPKGGARTSRTARRSGSRARAMSGGTAQGLDWRFFFGTRNSEPGSRLGSTMGGPAAFFVYGAWSGNSRRRSVSVFRPALPQRSDYLILKFGVPRPPKSSPTINALFYSSHNKRRAAVSDGERPAWLVEVERAAAAGDRKALSCLNFHNAARGRGPIDVDDEVAALRELMAAGITQAKAIGIVARQAGTRSRERTWRRRLKEIVTQIF